MNFSLFGYYILDYATLSMITIKYSYQINLETLDTCIYIHIHIHAISRNPKILKTLEERKNTGDSIRKTRMES